MKKIIVAAVLLVVTGCGAQDTTPKVATQQQSTQDRIAAIQSNPNIPDQAKSSAIAQIQRASHAPGGTPTSAGR